MISISQKSTNYNRKHKNLLEFYASLNNNFTNLAVYTNDVLFKMYSLKFYFNCKTKYHHIFNKKSRLKNEAALKKEGGMEGWHGCSYTLRAYFKTSSDVIAERAGIEPAALGG